MASIPTIAADFTVAGMASFYPRSEATKELDILNTLPTSEIETWMTLSLGDL